MKRRSLFLICCAVVLMGFPLPKVFAEGSHEVEYKGPFKWPGVPYKKVVGYEFDDAKTLDGSLIGEGGFLDRELARCVQKQAGLGQKQVNQLVGAVTAPKRWDGAMTCYFPHHVFVFYSEENVPVAAIEVCFGCREVAAWPSVARPWGPRIL